MSNRAIVAGVITVALGTATLTAPALARGGSGGHAGFAGTGLGMHRGLTRATVTITNRHGSAVVIPTRSVASTRIRSQIQPEVIVVASALRSSAILPQFTVPIVPQFTAQIVPQFTVPIVPQFTAQIVQQFIVPIVPQFTAQIVPQFTAPIVPQFTVPIVRQFTAQIAPPFGTAAITVTSFAVAPVGPRRVYSRNYDSAFGYGFGTWPLFAEPWVATSPPATEAPLPAVQETGIADTRPTSATPPVRYCHPVPSGYHCDWPSHGSSGTKPG